jgi:DNA helicase-2/ATP-dependent DNA helicase PcrA
MIDEFQDTSPAQYRLVRFLAGDAFRNVFAVADDDQIIYQWAGASYQQILEFRKHFAPTLFQLVENRRCPPRVVEVANNLISHNVDRTPDKAALVATLPAQGDAISVRVFESQDDEATGVASEIAGLGGENWGDTAVLGRTRAILTPVLEALRRAGVRAAIATRRDRFISPQFIWLQACLDQSLRPADRQVFVSMVGAANRVSGLGDSTLDAARLLAEADASRRSYLEQWTMAALDSGNETATRLGQMAHRLVQSRGSWSSVVSDALSWLPQTSPTEDGVISDAADDKAAWETATRAIRSEKWGEALDLAELLQGIALRPKEPPPDPNSVSIMTVHAAKGLEFGHVWVVGLAQGVLPSWQSLQTNAAPAELEEERRNCFVAITRTKQRLYLAHAQRYGGYAQKPSVFLAEMGLKVE